MFDDPDDVSGVNESSYANRRFIEDEVYTKSTSSNNSSGRFPRYLDVVLGFRMVSSNTFSTLDNYWDGLKTKLESLGMPTGTGGVGSYEFIMRNAYVGWWDDALGRYTGKYDVNPSVVVNSDGNETRGPNDSCPAGILPLTGDRTLIEEKMDDIAAFGNTDSANGAIWGVRVLSPGAPFTEGVPYDDGQWTKAMVLMTDGENTVGSSSMHWKSALTSYGYALEQRMGVGVNTASEMRDEIDEKLIRICHRAKQQGVLVYTIIFGLDDANTEEVFKACATEPIAPYYYKAPTASELEAAFGDIAQDLVKLHVSK
jgi:hypothetical protein